MKANKYLGWVMMVAMVGASATAYKLTPTQLLADTLPRINLQNDFPSQVGDWKVDTRAQITIPNPETEGVIESIYTDTLSRVYVDPTGKQLFLSVAYGKNQSDGHSLHYPEVCYPAQGYMISEHHIGSIRIGAQTVPVKHLVAMRGEQPEPITYWATVGQKIILNGTQHKLAQLRYGFEGYIPDGMIVRVSTLGDDRDHEYEVQREFLEALARTVNPETRSRMLGELASGVR